MALGVNWYSNFDRPVQHGREWWIGHGDLGSIRGGHCIAARPHGQGDSTGWWAFYDQGEEGACVGFGCSRVVTLLNRARYDARWLYREAQKVDEWEGEDYEGTSVRAGFDVLRSRGHRRVVRGRSLEPDPDDGIAANRWASTSNPERGWQEIRTALGVPDRRAGVPLLNSWGRSYPHVVYLADEAGVRLLREEGEAGIATDR